MNDRERLQRWAGPAALLWIAASCRSHSTPPLESGLARGDRVVVEARAGEFFEGRVLNVASERVKVQALSDDLLEVETGDVYRVTGSKWAGHPDAYGICNTTEAHWEGCQVEAVQDEQLGIVTLDGRHIDLSVTQVIPPSAVTELNLEQRFDLAKARGRFTDQARLAGRPRRPPDWKPARHEPVLARRGDRWIPAKVTRSLDAGVGVSWQDQEPARVVPSSDVIPVPPYVPPVPPRVGGFALMRSDLPGEGWIDVKVTALTDRDATVVDQEGRVYQAQWAGLVPLEH